jgi:hypothetical protein
MVVFLDPCLPKSQFERGEPVFVDAHALGEEAFGWDEHYFHIPLTLFIFLVAAFAHRRCQNPDPWWMYSISGARMSANPCIIHFLDLCL